MNENTLREAKAHAEREFPRESCGVVVVIKGRERYWPCKNLAEQPKEQFIMDPRDKAEAEDHGEIMAIVHSHPNASTRASEADRVACEMSGVPWHIIHVSIPDDEESPKAGEHATIEPCGYEAPLVGRQFVHGVLDCYTLIRDWYQRERGITLKNWMRSDGWWERGEDLYREHYGETGFVRVNDEPQPGDVILMQIRSPENPNHAAVYLGDGVMLHHLYGRLSSRDLYGGYWVEMTREIIRYVGEPK